MSSLRSELFPDTVSAADTYLEENLIHIRSGIPTILAGSQGLIYAGLQAVLNLSKFHIVACIGCTREVDALASLLPPRFLIIVDDSRTPKFVADGADIERLREAFPEAILAVIVGGHFAQMDMAPYLAANVVINHRASAEQLINILNIAMDGVAILPMASASAVPIPDVGWPRSMASNVDPSLQQGPGLQRPLSDREIAILQCLSAGQSNKSIAQLLSITDSTVKIHLKGIFRKISAVNRTQAAIWALTNLKHPDQG